MQQIEMINKNLRVWARRMNMEVTAITMEKVKEIFIGMDHSSRAIPMALVAMKILRDNNPLMDKILARQAGIVVGITAKFMAYEDMSFYEAVDKIKISQEQEKILFPFYREMKEICLNMEKARRDEYSTPRLGNMIRDQIKNGQAIPWDE